MARLARHVLSQPVLRRLHYELKKSDQLDRVREIIHKAKQFDEERFERLRLDGYCKTLQGELISETELLDIFFADKDGNLPSETPGTFTDYESLTHFPPEKFVDVLESKGEQDVRPDKYYPKLNLMQGEVLRDRKNPLGHNRTTSFVCRSLMGKSKPSLAWRWRKA